MYIYIYNKSVHIILYTQREASCRRKSGRTAVYILRACIECDFEWFRAVHDEQEVFEGARERLT